MLTNLLALATKQKSITQTLSPSYRKLSGVKPAQQKINTQITIETIREEYSQVNYAMDNLQNSLNDRMNNHQKQLLKIMKIQISKILQDVRKIVKVFNQMIKQKNFSQDLWETKNQVEYFKFQAIRLFEQNKNLKRQIIVLKQQMQTLSFQEKCQSIALKKLTKKLVKEKIRRNALSMHHINEIKSINNQQRIEQTNRKRHESLSTNLPKFTKKGQQSEKKEFNTIKTNIQLSKSKSQVQKPGIKTEPQEVQRVYYSPKLHGYSQRVKILCNNGASQKIKFLKQRTKLDKNKQKQQNDDLVNMLNQNI